MKKQTLSDKSWKPIRLFQLQDVVSVQDVKDFIKQLKKKMYKNDKGNGFVTVKGMERIIYNLAGDKLTK